MRIGIDARLYSESGIGRYIKNLLYYLQKLDSENQYFILLRKKEFEEIHFKNKNFQKVLADIKWYGIAEQMQLPGLLYSLKLDLVHFPHFNIPIMYRGKFIVTIHDLIHQKFQMRRATTRDPFTYWIKHNAYTLAFSTALKKSEKIITVSDYVQNELIQKWGVLREKIVVTKEGVEEQLLKNAKNCTQKEIDRTLNKFEIRQPYLFYVGNAHPHKNVEGLINAFLQLRKKYQYLQLVLSGGGHYFWDRIKAEYQHKDIIYTGYVTDDELVALYKGCKEYVFPSFEEGFGIPLLEAMACGVPVASSNRASLPEVGGDAALYFDPTSQNEMIEKITLILNSQKLQQELIEKGKVRIKEFSWERMVNNTLQAYIASSTK